MRLSRPMPRATSCTLAPTFSQRSAISLMKVIFVARNALAAYLMSSDGAAAGEEERRAVEVKRAVDFAASPSRARSSSTPMTMRSGRLKSSIAAPSRRNSGLETTAKSASGRASRMMRSTSSPVPTGTVDFVTTTVKPLSAGGDVARGLIDIGEIGVAVAAPGRRSDGDEDGLRLAHALGEIGREGEPFLAHVVGDEIGEPRLENRHLAGLQRLDFLDVGVDADDIMPEVGEARAGHQPDIS